MDLKALLDQVENDVEKEEQLLFGNQRLTPTQQEIVRILEEQPILVKPTLDWLQAKKAHLSAVQLLALYNVQDIKAMYSEEEWKIFKEKYNIKEE